MASPYPISTPVLPLLCSMSHSFMGNSQIIKKMKKKNLQAEIFSEIFSTQLVILFNWDGVRYQISTKMSKIVRRSSCTVHLSRTITSIHLIWFCWTYNVSSGRERTTCVAHRPHHKVTTNRYSAPECALKLRSNRQELARALIIACLPTSGYGTKPRSSATKIH